MDAPEANSAAKDRILVIKLSALGDVVQAFGPFAAIRAYHADQHLTLLTTAAYEGLARQSGYFDAVQVDERPKALDPAGWLRLRRRLREGAFTRVYDLQTSRRSSRYFRLFWPGPRPEWSGIAPGCSHPHANPNRDDMHTLERQAEQLSMAGIGPIPQPDLSMLKGAIDPAALPSRYCLLVPGGAAHRRAKRWPWESYAELARRLMAGPGITPILIGQEAALLEKIAAQAPGTVNLAGKTSIGDIASLSRGAEFAVGNDTGPMHVVTLSGAKSIVLYSQDSDPKLCGQRGPDVTILRRDQLADLSVNEVITAL